MRMHLGLLLGTLLSLSMGTAAQADLVIGGLPLAGVGVSEDGTNLANSTTISALFNVSSGLGSGDLAGIPLLTEFVCNPIDLGLESSGFGYMLSNPNWGTFTATSGSIEQQSANLLDLFMEGVFEPGTNLAGLDSTPTTLRVTINQNGNALSEAITLNAVPEPSSLALLGFGSMLGLIGVARRKWKKA